MELKFPPEGTPEYTWLNYQMEKEQGTYPGSEGSFCRTFMEIMDEQIHENAGSFRGYVGTTVKDMFNSGMEALDLLTGHERGAGKAQYSHMKDLCDRMNYTYRHCRDKINDRMVEFLLENDGVIDRWPLAEDVRGLSVDHKQNGPDASNLEFYFAYFGTDYAPAGYKIYRIAPDTTWKNKFYYGKTRKLKDLHDRKRELELLQSKQKDNRGLFGKIKRFLFLQPIILSVVFLIHSLICFFMNVNPAVQMGDWLEYLSWIPGFLMFIPKWILLILAMISELLRINPVVFWIGTILLTVAGIGAGIHLCGKPDVARVKNDVYQQTLQELQQATMEYEEAEAEWSEVSKAWNKAYFQVCRAKSSF